MLSEEKTIEIVNKYLQHAHEANIRRSFPVVASKIYSDGPPQPAVAHTLSVALSLVFSCLYGKFLIFNA